MESSMISDQSLTDVNLSWFWDVVTHKPYILRNGRRISVEAWNSRRLSEGLIGLDDFIKMYPEEAFLPEPSGGPLTSNG